MNTNYDAVSPAYARHRRINPATLGRLIQVGQLGVESRVLEVGSGSGNYISALVQITKCRGHGLEPSAGMLSQAKIQNSAVTWTQGNAHVLPYPDASFDLLFCVDVIHHVAESSRFLTEAFRVLRNGGQICVATDSEWTIRNRNPLSIYFPATVEKELERYPSLTRLKEAMTTAGFSDAAEEVIEFHYTLEEIEAYKTNTFSCLQLISETDHINGMHRLSRDFSQGPIHGDSRHALLSASKTSRS